MTATCTYYGHTHGCYLHVVQTHLMLLNACTADTRGWYMHALQTHMAATCTYYRHMWLLHACTTDTYGAATCTHMGLLHACTTDARATYIRAATCMHHRHTRGCYFKHHTYTVAACMHYRLVCRLEVGKHKKFFGVDHQEVFFGFEWQRFPRYLCSICM